MGFPMPLSAGANAGAGFDAVERDRYHPGTCTRYRAEAVSVIPDDLSEGRLHSPSPAHEKARCDEVDWALVTCCGLGVKRRQQPCAFHPTLTKRARKAEQDG
jgi:hypothetical protein